MEGNLKLVGYKYSTTGVQRILAAAKFSNATVTLENVNWGDSKREELKKNSQTTTFPYLVTPYGTLSEGFSIVQYLANTYNKSLLGENAWDRAQVDQWVEFAHLEVLRYMKDIIYPLFGFSEYNKEKSDAATKELKEWLKVLNTQLEGKQYFVGNSYTLADLELFSALRAYLQFVFVEDVRKNLFPNVTAWFVKLAGHPNIVSTYGRTLLCKIPQKAPKVEKKETPKKEEAKKEEKTEKAQKNQEGDDEEKTTKKKGNPLDLLPPSQFVLDDFKREFMNSKDRPAVMAEFWKKFDANGYSFWTMRYDKLPSEGKILFRTKNSLSFFLQKLDTFRKYCFSVHGIYGVEGDYDIRGLWMWRGLDIPEEVKQHESYDYMIIKKLDTTSADDRKLIDNYWLNLEEGNMVDGLPVAYVETFK